MSRLKQTLTLLALSFALYSCGPKTEEEPAWIGLVAALSGPERPAGTHLKQGVALAVDDVVSQRVEGRRLAVVSADDRGSDEAVQAETVRLLAVNRAAALIAGADAGRAAVLVRAAQPYGAPIVLPSECADPLPGNAAFSLAVRPGWRGQILACYASAELKLPRAAVLTDGRNPIAVELASAFVKEWPRDQGFSVQQETFHTDAELRDLAARATGAKPAVLLIAADAAVFLKVRDLLDSTGLHAPLLFYGGEDNGAEALTARPGDLYTATVVAQAEFTERGQAFAKRYEERFHERPDLAAVQGCDAARVLFDAMARAKTSAADKVRDQLAATVDFESLTGPLTFRDGRARRRVFVVHWTDGQAKVVQRVEPELDEPSAGR